MRSPVLGAVLIGAVVLVVAGVAEERGNHRRQGRRRLSSEPADDDDDTPTLTPSSTSAVAPKPTRKPTRKPSHPPTSRPTTPVAPSPTPATCPLEAVPLKAFTACVLANGFCVATEEDCRDLGGVLDKAGCGGGASCACCRDLPTDAPSAVPTTSLAPTSEAPTATPTAPTETCAMRNLPRRPLMDCLRLEGTCVVDHNHCAELGGALYLQEGCGDHCACCAHIPGDDDQEALPTRYPSTMPPSTRPPPPSNSTIKPRPLPPATAAPSSRREDKSETAAPSASEEHDKEPRIRRYHSDNPVAYLKEIGLVFLVVLACGFFPPPQNQFLRAVRWPFFMIFVGLQAFLVYLLSACFSFGEGIAESRPPAPIQLRNPDIEMADRNRIDEAEIGLLDDADDDDDEATSGEYCDVPDDPTPEPSEDYSRSRKSSRKKNKTPKKSAR